MQVRVTGPWARAITAIAGIAGIAVVAIIADRALR
jgi:hypothetical protein